MAGRDDQILAPVKKVRLRWLVMSPMRECHNGLPVLVGHDSQQRDRSKPHGHAAQAERRHSFLAFARTLSDETGHIAQAIAPCIDR